jgi:hypothetical protein
LIAAFFQRQLQQVRRVFNRYCCPDGPKPLHANRTLAMI